MKLSRFVTVDLEYCPDCNIFLTAILNFNLYKLVVRTVRFDESIGGLLQHGSSDTTYPSCPILYLALCSSYLPWRPSCLDRGALIYVDTPGCGTSVV